MKTLPRTKRQEKNLYLLLKLNNQEWYLVALRPFYDLDSYVERKAQSLTEI